MSNHPRRRTTAPGAALYAVAALLLLVCLRTEAQRVRQETHGGAANSASEAAHALRLTPRRVSLSGGRSFSLSLPEGFDISVAAEGLKRVRFMARSPDGRIFVTDMHDLSDNTKGAVYILDEFDAAGRRFKRVIPYLTHLRNPNSVAFYTDRQGVEWFYLALTDRLVRYRYEAGGEAPTGRPEVLATFPDYGLNYKYGG
jgi:glucose/arabinose dehydrogenase